MHVLFHRVNKSIGHFTVVYCTLRLEPYKISGKMFAFHRHHFVDCLNGFSIDWNCQSMMTYVIVVPINFISVNKKSKSIGKTRTLTVHFRIIIFIPLEIVVELSRRNPLHLARQTTVIFDT